MSDAAPERRCNGGPHGSAWCGKPAAVVCTAADGLQWYACHEHTEGAATMPLSAWWEFVVRRIVTEPVARPESWNDPDTIRSVARDRSSHLQKVRASYQSSLELALEDLERIAQEHDEAKALVSELRAKLAPLADEIAHLEACAATEAPTLEMLVWIPPERQR